MGENSFGARMKSVRGYLWLACLLSACITLTIITFVAKKYGTGQSDELLLKLHLAAHEPYSAPANLYLWWGPETNHRFAGSGERIRQLLHLGTIEGGEWRDPMFLGNNGVETFASSRFRRISEQCCSTILFPPMEWSFPVFNVHKIVGQRIRNYVANGNIFVLTGGIPAIEFINAYFFYTMELADGNYSPGPFRRLDKVPKQMRDTPKILPQKGISVTAVKKESLPSGATVLWGTPRTTPVFMIKFCEAQSPDEGMPPVKVLPRDCPMSAQQGRPCSCGHIIYIGYTFGDPYPSRWDKVLLASVEILNPTWDCEHPGLASKPCAAAAAPTALAPAPAPAAAPAPAKPAAAKKAASGSGAALSAVAEEDRVAAALVTALSTLEKRAAAPVAAHAEEDGTQSLHQGPPSLPVLEAQARALDREIRSAEVSRGARRSAGRGRRSARRGAGGEDALLEQSIVSLAQDVKKINGKVERIATAVATAARPSAPHALAAPVAPAQATILATAPPPAAAAAAEIQAAAAKAAAAATAALQARLARERRRAARLAKQARAYKKELAYEQSMPTPAYSYHEPDHTTPYFAHDGRRAAARPGCGAMCRLRRLVEKTRGRIDAELTAAMRGGASAAR